VDRNVVLVGRGGDAGSLVDALALVDRGVGPAEFDRQVRDAR